MEVLVLGTGAADGWPAPFCVCASCTTLRGRGEVRAQTSALVDDVLLLDCGPETARAATRAGRPLNRVHTVLLTHEHPDHCDPSFILWRGWTERDEPLLVTGPAAALDRCADWVGPDDPIELREVRAGDVFDAGDHAVRVVAAAHREGSVLYDVTAPDGASVLYATDTGPLPESTVQACAGRRLDVLLMEESFGVPPSSIDPSGHHTLATFAADVARLRAVDAVTATTAVVAVHLSHFNSPEPALSEELAPTGAIVVPDLTSIRVAAAGTQPVVLPPGSSTARRVLVTGGARSGKSRTAERLLAGEPAVTYVATGTPADGDDADWAARVRDHQERRPSHWRTAETLDVAAVLAAAGPEDAVLVDCLALWLSRTIDAHVAWDDDAALAHVDADVERLVAAVSSTQARVVLVTNEVGAGVVPATRSGRLFRDRLGTLNLRVAEVLDEVRLVVAGREVVL
jgi:adenosylcobinamide kinase/adenosylcobinamide-phosphate guanylyltransferase